MILPAARCVWIHARRSQFTLLEASRSAGTARAMALSPPANRAARSQLRTRGAPPYLIPPRPPRRPAAPPAPAPRHRSARTRIVHHLSGPNKYALTQTCHSRSWSVDGAPLRDPTLSPSFRIQGLPPYYSHMC